MIKILLENPLMLLLMVAALGYPLGKIKVYGITLGVGAVLFVGLAFGMLHPDMKAPAIVYIMGQALFVYTVGLSAGPSFISTFRRNGVMNNVLAGGVLCASAALCVAMQRYFAIKPGIAAGIFCGSMTASPALGGALESIRQTAPADMLEALLAEPVVGFSVAYPIGVIGLMLTINVCQKIWKVDYQAEFKVLRKPEDRNSLVHCTIKVQHVEPPETTVQKLNESNNCDVIFSRIKRGDEFFYAGPTTVLQPGDLAMVAGAPHEIEKIATVLGERRSKERLGLDRTEYEYRRVFVSSPQAIGRTIGELHQDQRFGEVITLVRRGDNEFLPEAEMVLELGDVVRVLAHKTCMDDVTAFFGNSYRRVSEVDVMTFSLGLVIGLVLGLIPFPFPGGGSMQLGFAGGPLIVGILLGTFGRTGKMVWSLPYSASMVLKQVGLVLFLAGIGTRSGYSLLTTLSHGGGGSIFITGVCVTSVTAFLGLFIAHKIMKLPMTLAVGIVAGMHTSTPGLGYIKEQTGNDLSDQGYACVFPFATIGKIILVHIILVATGQL
ncbi:aspartate:alanine exchanger family transporter [Geomonas azotofigens]|uniref:aspartate:alanine exchanger family transporter n=1 Tax=Geomonas azotofigens TaxID=2843196 RepID=UPI001C1087A1|nr:aspartate:alanine exchanger family transporter [Geomonas azotofigens]MBU5614367.1 transporter [Geomonas azotofigens]